MRHLTLLLALLPTLAVAQPEAGKPIPIGLAGPMTGPGAAYGASVKRGAELAIRQLNAAGLTRGGRLALQVEDDKGDPTEALAVARKLAADRHLPIIVGHLNSACTNQAKIEYNRAGVVSISPGSTNDAVCKGFKWTFRNLYRDADQGKQIARYLQAQLGAKRVAVFYENDSYGRAMRDRFLAAAKRIGLGTLTPRDYTRARTQDFTALVRPIVAQKPDAILVSGLYIEAGLICRATRDELKLAIPIIGTDGLVSPGFVQRAGKSAEGALAVSPYHFDPERSNAKAKAFEAAYRKAFKAAPDPWAALTYDAVMLAAQAIQAVGTDREKIRAWLAAKNTRDRAVEGVTGPTYFDAEGDCLKPLQFTVVKDGKWQLAPKQLGR